MLSEKDFTTNREVFSLHLFLLGSLNAKLLMGKIGLSISFEFS